jgi:hypothetical protein
MELPPTESAATARERLHVLHLPDFDALQPGTVIFGAPQHPDGTVYFKHFKPTKTYPMRGRRAEFVVTKSVVSLQDADRAARERIEIRRLDGMRMQFGALDLEAAPSRADKSPRYYALTQGADAFVCDQLADGNWQIHALGTPDNPQEEVGVAEGWVFAGVMGQFATHALYRQNNPRPPEQNVWQRVVGRLFG